jgi:hypothetical protein
MQLHFQSVLSPRMYQLVHRPRTFPSRCANRGHHHHDATYTGDGNDDAPVEVGEVEATEATELFQKCAKLKSPGPDGNAPDRGELGAGDHANRVVYHGDTTIGVGDIVHGGGEAVRDGGEPAQLAGVSKLCRHLSDTVRRICR